MRFRRWPGVSSFEDTLRKRSALARRQQAQREKLPMLGTLIAEQQPDAGEVMAQRAEKSVRSSRKTATTAHGSGGGRGRNSPSMATIAAAG